MELMLAYAGFFFSKGKKKCNNACKYVIFLLNIFQQIMLNVLKC